MNIDTSRPSRVSTKNTYKATAKVGRDTIEAEYITFEHIKFKKDKTFKDKLEDLWFYISMPFWKTKHWMRETYWEIRYGFQRMFKGYDSVDTFETFAKFIERYTKILKEYRKKHWGIPMEFVDSEKEWDKIVDEMLYHLRYMDEETVTNELEKNVPDDWHASHITVYEVMEKHKNAFFELFSKYFYDLWD